MEKTDIIPSVDYNDDAIIHLEDMDHIRHCAGMYIGRLGDGTSQDDGIYVLIKEVVDNAIDEHTSGFGKKVDVSINYSEKRVSIRDYSCLQSHLCVRTILKYKLRAMRRILKNEFMNAKLMVIMCRDARSCVSLCFLQSSFFFCKSSD